jgi:nitric oxide reductase NorE protein
VPVLKFTTLVNLPRFSLTNQSLSTETPLQVKKLPGDVAMWFFIMIELTTFTLFFIAFAIADNLNVAQFHAGKATLDPIIGLVCTIALITSSYFAALAVIQIKLDNPVGAKYRLWLALFMALIYVVAKLWEYVHLFGLGYELSTNTFYTLYFFTTFFHFMHVLLGMIILIYMSVRTTKNVYTSKDHDGFEAGVCYWHMVDLVWVILFPLIYIIR